MENGPTPLSMTYCRGFVWPRYMITFKHGVSRDITASTRGWLEAGGLRIVVDNEAEDGRPASFVATASREQLEVEAERWGYLKAHRALKPHALGQGLGKIEFVREPRRWVEGFEGYDDPDFWLPCERSQLLGSLIGRVPAPPNILAHYGPWPSLLSFLRSQNCTFSGSLVTSLQLAGILDEVLPMDDGAMERQAIWNTGLSPFGLCKPVLPAIQRYFGANVALYFAWMNSYTSWLLMPACVGLLCYVHEQRYGYSVDDNPMLPAHSIFTVLWGVAFLCNWERTCATRTWEWGVYGAERVQEVRPQFFGTLRKSPISGDCERYYPPWRRLLKYALSCLLTGVLLFVVFFVHICSLNLQGYMTEHVTRLENFFYFHPLAKWAKPGAVFDPDQTEYFGALALLPVFLHTLVIRLFNRGYRWLAELLTVDENHRLATEHENSLIVKRVFFEAFDSYIGLFYIAFIEQDVRKLSRQLKTLFCMDSARRVMLETILPLLGTSWRHHTRRACYAKLKESNREGYAEALYYLDQPEYEEFEDYLEMVIEFGYVTLFASAFPLAGGVAIVCNLIEMKSDLFKLTCVCRRPVAERAATIGAWKHVLQVLAALSIVTNLMIFSLSEQLASWAPEFYREATVADVRRGIVASVVDDEDGGADLVVREGNGAYVMLIGVILEHSVFLLAAVMTLSIPRVPERVANELARLGTYKERQATAMRKHHFNRQSMRFSF